MVLNSLLSVTAVPDNERLAVELHPKLFRLALLLALNFDPNINRILLNQVAGERRGDRRRRGIIIM